MVRSRYAYPGFREFIDRVLVEHGDPDSNITEAFSSVEHHRKRNTRWSLFIPREL